MPTIVLTMIQRLLQISNTWKQDSDQPVAQKHCGTQFSHCVGPTSKFNQQFAKRLPMARHLRSVESAARPWRSTLVATSTELNHNPHTCWCQPVRCRNSCRLARSCCSPPWSCCCPIPLRGRQAWRCRPPESSRLCPHALCNGCYWTWANFVWQRLGLATGSFSFGSCFKAYAIRWMAVLVYSRSKHIPSLQRCATFTLWCTSGQRCDSF